VLYGGRYRSVAPTAANPLPHALNLMRGQVPGPQRGDEDLVQIREEAVTIHRPVE
jgi:hypothetical protein